MDSFRGNRAHLQRIYRSDRLAGRVIAEGSAIKYVNMSWKFAHPPGRPSR